MVGSRLMRRSIRLFLSQWLIFIFLYLFKFRWLFIVSLLSFLNSKFRAFFLNWFIVDCCCTLKIVESWMMNHILKILCKRIYGLYKRGTLKLKLIHKLMKKLYRAYKRGTLSICFTSIIHTHSPCMLMYYYEFFICFLCNVWCFCSKCDDWCLLHVVRFLFVCIVCP